MGLMEERDSGCRDSTPRERKYHESYPYVSQGLWIQGVLTSRQRVDPGKGSNNLVKSPEKI